MTKFMENVISKSIRDSANPLDQRQCQGLLNIIEDVLIRDSKVLLHEYTFIVRPKITLNNLASYEIAITECIM